MKPPPRDEAAWYRTRQVLEERVVGRVVRVRPKREGPSHSLIAEVRLEGGALLAEAMVREGHAWWDLGEAPEYHRLRNVQDDARVRKVGLWALPEPGEPRGHRRTKMVVPARNND